jgi:phosphate transport system substrate-binding protein
MKRLFLCSCLIISLWACNNNSSKGEKDGTAQGIIKIDGSSTVYPISEAIAEEFNKENPKIKVTIGESGTGGGFKKFVRGDIDIIDASRPIKKSEDSSAVFSDIQYIELPIAFDGLAVVINPKNTWVDYLTVAELKKIWEPEAQGKIKTWNQIKPNWPKEEINLYGAGTQSGTFDYFTEAINGKSRSCRGDYTASEDDNILVQGVSTDKNSLGFFGLSYFSANKEKLKLVPIDDQKDENGKGPIGPSIETVKNATYQPLSRPLFIYVNKKSTKRPEVDQFVKYYIRNAEVLVPEAGYVPLTKIMYELVESRYDKKVISSSFLKLKTDVGIKMEDILKIE